MSSILAGLVRLLLVRDILSSFVLHFLTFLRCRPRRNRLSFDHSRQETRHQSLPFVSLLLCCPFPPSTDLFTLTVEPGNPFPDLITHNRIDLGWYFNGKMRAARWKSFERTVREAEEALQEKKKQV
jgi:hypothetical protein